MFLAKFIKEYILKIHLNFYCLMNKLNSTYAFFICVFDLFYHYAFWLMHNGSMMLYTLFIILFVYLVAISNDHMINSRRGTVFTILFVYLHGGSKYTADFRSKKAKPLNNQYKVTRYIIGLDILRVFQWLTLSLRIC